MNQNFKLFEVGQNIESNQKMYLVDHVIQLKLLMRKVKRSI